MSVTNAYKSVQCLPCGLASVETVIDFVCPGSHLDCTNEIRVDFHLRIEAREKGWKVIAYEIGLRSCRRVESGQRKAADILRNSCQEIQIY
jgi:hypothetical protein